MNAGFSLTDVRVAGTLADYGGDLQALLDVRLTDGASGPSQSEARPSRTCRFRSRCRAPRRGTAAGSTCAVATSFDAVVPGSVQERKRAIWALDQVEVLDGGADGAQRTSEHAVRVQGVFVPEE